MEVVALAPRSIDAYAESAGAEAVAEILWSAVPLLRDLGLDASWQTIVAEPAFFAVTKAIHNALQGAPCSLTPEELATYVAWQHDNAASLADNYDVIVVHDPQPLGLRRAAGPRGARWIWRLHVDSSHPNPAVWAFLRPFLAGYHASVFTMPQFVPPNVDATQVRIIAPAIDPLTPKNRSVPQARALAILAELGLDPGRPLVAQVSRLDPWKDPTGVIDAYRLVRKSNPGLQLALLGVIAARDDPEAIGMAEEVRAHAGGDPDIRLYVDPTQVGREEVAAVQQTAQVVFQKSLREGFGLTVAEALWKVTPVVGGQAGGIPLQLQDGIGGFLVASVAAAAERARWLLEHPPEARAIAARGRDRVRADFLITRLLADELRLYADILDQRGVGDMAAD